MFAAIFDPFDRPAKRGRGGDNGDILRIDTQLRSKAAADIRRCHAQAAFIERDVVGQSGAKIVRLLRRSPNYCLATGNLGENAAAFHGMRRAAVDPELIADDVRSFRKSRFDVAVAHFVRNDAVRAELASHRRRAFRTAIESCRYDFVIDFDQRGCIFGRVTVGGDDNCYRLADKRDFAIGEREGPALRQISAGIGHPVHPPLLHHRRKIVEREHRDHARHCASGARIKAADQGMGMRAARERSD